MADTTRHHPANHDGEDAERYRLAQAHRIARFCKEHGLDLRAVQSGELGGDVLAPIRGGDGKVVPEREDIEAVR